jgi:NADPH:quinone reductase-like Zn-dependent oxidoreductase
VIDYTTEDFTRTGERYDVLFDVAGSRYWWDCKRFLKDDGVLVMVGAPKGNPVLGPLAHLAAMRVASLGAKQKMAFFIAKFNREDFLALNEMLETGTVRPVIDRTYPLSEIAAALNYLGEGHARGKIAITI